MYKLLSVALFLPLIVACAGEVDDENSEAEASDLSASRIQLLGTIKRGETLRAEYTPAPRYRAYAFTAQAGDKVDFWVRSHNGGNAHAYLLRPSFSTLASNRDAPEGGKDAHIRATIATQGTYYIAFRDEAESPASFEVEFTGDNTSGDNTFPICNGTPRFPTTGTLRATRIQVHKYARTCNAFGECEPWKKTGVTDALPTIAGGNRTSLELDRRVRVGISLGRYVSTQGSSSYNCEDSDVDSSGLSQVDETGQGDIKMQHETWCSPGPSRRFEPRPAHVSVGSSCMSVAENDPNVAYGAQTKTVYVATFDPR